MWSLEKTSFTVNYFRGMVWAAEPNALAKHGVRGTPTSGTWF